jgi:DNA/RNA-binding domain of Phe-tRNA-synthetase-like protein
MSDGDLGLRAARGFVEAALEAEFPGLRLDWVTVEVRASRSPREVARRLAQAANRYRGASVVALRAQPIPHAYRAFFRQIGLDPDVDRIPAERAALERLMHGGFRSRGLVPDAALIALIETGVPVWALDADALRAGGLGIRASAAGDRLGSGKGADDVPPGRLVVADEENVHALLFGDVAQEHAVGARTARVALFTVAVEGVPAIHVEEALWVAVEVIEAV